LNSGPSFQYTWTPARPAVAKISTSRTELTSIGIAFAVLTFDLVIIISRSGLVFGSGASFLSGVTLVEVITAAVAALTGFVAHELAHKIVAQRLGYWAEFRMSPAGLVLSLITATLGFLWAAPGATVVSGMSERDRANWGRTSLAGPVSNVGFAVVFYGGSFALFHAGSAWFLPVLFLAFVNAWFATFNLLPIGPLDGAKVLRWSTATWLGAIVTTGTLAAVTYVAYFVYGTPFLAG
jgi:Zn-dependent protease